MRKRHRLSFLLVPFAAIAAAAEAPKPPTPFNLLLWPQALKVESAGELPLSAASKIVASDASLAPLAGVLAGEIQMLGGFKPATATSAGQAGDIVLALDPALKNEAAYTLNVRDRVTVTGGGYIGAAHGTSLLLQAMSHSKTGLGFPKISVQDAPYSQYCGCMVDLARQDNLIEELKGVVDMSANTKPAVATGDMHKFASADARYVRITMLKNSANPGVHLVEARVLKVGK